MTIAGTSVNEKLDYLNQLCALQTLTYRTRKNSEGNGEARNEYLKDTPERSEGMPWS